MLVCAITSYLLIPNNCCCCVALQPHREGTSVRESIDWAVKCMKAMQTRISIAALVSPSTFCDVFFTDKHWLMENILCYLSNAVKYSLSGTVTISVTLIEAKEEQNCNSHRHDLYTVSERRTENSDETVLTPQQLRITVEDHGIGIPDAKRGDLFKPFQQTMRLAGGTGLGLYSLSKRVEALGGFYGVDNRQDGQQGSQFWFSVPYHPDTSGSKPRPAGPIGEGKLREISKRSRRCSSKASSERITLLSQRDQLLDDSPSVLLVEDSMVITKATRRMLIKAGFTVDTADNGALGLEKMKKNVYEFVLMDLQMPIMDGLEATRRIRSFENEVNIEGEDKQYIIGVSANSTGDTRRDAMGSGMCDFCAKPFSYQDLCDVQSRRIENNV